jgi:hypothetical protein
LIRTEYKNLESADWWKSQKIDGVVLYAWTKTKYTPIAKAIHESGLKLVVYLDTGASIYPWNDWWFWTKTIFRASRLRHHNCGVFFALIWILRMHTLSIANNSQRRKHLDNADLIGVPVPLAIDSHKRIPFLMSSLAKSRLYLVPNPVASHFRYNPLQSKEDRIIAVGRWDDVEQKRPRYLMKSIELFCSQTPSTQIDIFGFIPEFMADWHRALPPEWQKRITLHGIVKSQEIADYYQMAKICLCPSMHEGTHIASAEAVCCGCSVVVAPCPSLSAIHWYTSEQSGTIADKDTPVSFAEAISREVALWTDNRRNPTQISEIWCSRLHATNTARKILAFFEPPSCN